MFFGIKPLGINEVWHNQIGIIISWHNEKQMINKLKNSMFAQIIIDKCATCIYLRRNYLFAASHQIPEWEMLAGQDQDLEQIQILTD